MIPSISFVRYGILYALDTVKYSLPVLTDFSESHSFDNVYLCNKL